MRISIHDWQDDLVRGVWHIGVGLMVFAVSLTVLIAWWHGVPRYIYRPGYYGLFFPYSPVLVFTPLVVGLLCGLCIPRWKFLETTFAAILFAYVEILFLPQRGVLDRLFGGPPMAFEEDWYTLFFALAVIVLACIGDTLARFIRFSYAKVAYAPKHST